MALCHGGRSVDASLIGQSPGRRRMIDLILAHWATYLFLIWLLVVGIRNLWPRRKATYQL